eukprot:symbB.v1.2.006376.t3/scaffold371.1/size308833/23
MLYFTATWDENLPREIGKVFKSNYGSREPLLEVIVNGKMLSACSNVQQSFLRRTNGEPDGDAVEAEEREESRSLNEYWMEEDTKEDAFYRLLYWTLNTAERSDPGNSKILVFTNSKEKVGELYEIIRQNDIPVLKLTGEMHTRERNSIVTSFADPSKIDNLILITTDMLGRGIDFMTCRYVILDFPHHRNSVREYVHRIGRTGRAGRQGFAITLLDEKEGDFRHCAEIVKVLEASGQKPRQWMVAESSGRRQKYHRDLYFSLRNQRSEPLTPGAAETLATPRMDPTAPDPWTQLPAHHVEAPRTDPAASTPTEKLPNASNDERAALVQSAFLALNISGSGYLSESEMEPLAICTGLSGTEQEWREKFDLLRKKCCDKDIGVRWEHFERLVNDPGEDGVYCSDQKLRRLSSGSNHSLMMFYSYCRVDCARMVMFAIKPRLANEMTLQEWPALQSDLREAYKKKAEPFFDGELQEVVKWDKIKCQESTVEDLSEDLFYHTKNGKQVIICSVPEEHFKRVEEIRKRFNDEKHPGHGKVQRAWMSRRNLRREPR